ncbi:MAG: four helix bundle protein [Betaproteobacteria bacterium]|nr:MAG: four helix bundle protein [Betaproteobacteria bacterium]
MIPGKPHHNLDAWKESMALVGTVYEATRDFPPEETYALASQLRRAADSIPGNLAEAAGRDGHKEFAGIARGSLSELQTPLLIAADPGYLARKHRAFVLPDRVSRLLAGLHNSVAAPG